MKRRLGIALLICGTLGVSYFATRETNVRVGIRELKLPTFESSNISRIEYDGKEKFSLRKQKDKFFLETNENGVIRSVPAGKEVVKELFDAIVGIKGGNYVAERVAKHEEFKVSESKGQKVTLFAGEKAVWSLIIGDYAEEGGRFVRLPDSDAIFLVKARFWDITRSSPIDFRERNILAIDESDISTLKIENKGQTLGFVRDEKNNLGFDTTSTAQFPKVKASSSKVSDYVKLIAGLRAASFIETPDAIQRVKSLLDKSPERIVITTKPEDSEIVVKVATDAKEKKAYAQVVGSNALFEISDYAYARLHQKPEEFAEGAGEVEKVRPAAKGGPMDMNSLPPELQKQIQEAIRKQQGG